MLKRLVALAARLLPDVGFSVFAALLLVLVLEFLRVITS
jgi:hypothetical protein